MRLFSILHRRLDCRRQSARPPEAERAATALGDRRDSKFRVLGIPPTLLLPRADRRSALLQGVDLTASRGLEFGPLMSPLVGRQEGRIEYIDHLPTTALREKYAKDPNVDIEQIVDVDHILVDGGLPDSLAPESFDYVIACHVFEHLPNPLQWLADVASRLRPDGLLCLALPDKRFTFDRLRPPTRLASWIEAHLEDRRRPSAESVFDAAMLSVTMPLGATWRRPPLPEELRPQGEADPSWAVSLARQATREYFDVHCSVFTPATFLTLLAATAGLNLHPFALAGFGDTAEDGFEFYVQLANSPSLEGPARAALFRQAAAAAHAGSPHDRAA
jgi:SAM-dependent methyltransferase